MRDCAWGHSLEICFYTCTHDWETWLPPSSTKVTSGRLPVGPKAREWLLSRDRAVAHQPYRPLMDDPRDE